MRRALEGGSFVDPFHPSHIVCGSRLVMDKGRRLNWLIVVVQSLLCYMCCLIGANRNLVPIYLLAFLPHILVPIPLLG